MAEESASKAQAMSDQAGALRQLVAFFKTDDKEQARDAAWSQSERAASPKPVAPAALQKTADGAWSNF